MYRYFQHTQLSFPLLLDIHLDALHRMTPSWARSYSSVIGRRAKSINSVRIKINLISIYQLVGIHLVHRMGKPVLLFGCNTCYIDGVRLKFLKYPGLIYLFIFTGNYPIYFLKPKNKKNGGRPTYKALGVRPTWPWGWQSNPPKIKVSGWFKDLVQCYHPHGLWGSLHQFSIQRGEASGIGVGDDFSVTIPMAFGTTPLVQG